MNVALSCLTLCDPMDCSPPGCSVLDILGKNTAISLLQGIFPTQGLNPGLLHCRQISYHLSDQGSPSYRARTQKNKCQWWRFRHRHYGT